MTDKKDTITTHDDVDKEEMYNMPSDKMAQIVDASTANFMLKKSPARMSLIGFLSNHGREINNADEYNYIDQHFKKKWHVHQNAIPALVDLLEGFRKNEEPHGLSERQNGAARLFIDADIKLLENKPISRNPNMFSNILRTITKQIFKNVVPSDEFKTSTAYAYCESRSACTFDTVSTFYKDGFHIRFSTVFPQSFRKSIITEIAKDKKYKTYFQQHRDIVKNIDDIMDINSATVPVLQPGGTKANGVLYTKIAIYKIVYSHIDDDALIEEIPVEITDKWNIVERFGPIYVSRTDDGFTTTPTISPSFEKELDKIDYKVIEEIDNCDSKDISIIHMNDPLSREISQVLDLLSKTRSEDYKTWWKVLIALAQYGEKYKPLARVFSIQSKNKFDETYFEKEWEKCLNECKKYPGISIGFLKKIAKLDDPNAYRLISDGFLLQKILEAIQKTYRFTQDKKTAALGDFNIADILYTAFPDKYIAAPKIGNNGKKMSDDSDVNYYSMITIDSQEYTPGSAYKYTLVMSMAPLNIYISRKMPVILEQVRAYYTAKKDEPEQKEGLVKFFTLALGIIGKAYTACINHNAKKSIMGQFAMLCTNFKFEAELDAHPYAYGVYDGILETGVEPRLIQDVCEYKVSRFTLSKYILMDPMQTILQKTIQVFLDFAIIEEFDIICYILILQSSTLSKKLKALFLLNIEGNGRNGKSSLIQFLASALGNVAEGGYSHRMEMDYFTKERTGAGSAQTDLMAIEHATYITTSEPGESEHIIESKWKLLMSGETISGREMYGRQRNFQAKGIMIISSNRAIRFKDTPGRCNYKWDDGTTRRLKVVKARMEYEIDPDTTNPYQRKVDSSVLLEMVPSPLYGGALLSILSVIHAVYIMEHGQDMAKICSPNVEKQTADHIKTFDKLGKFINAQCVTSEKVEVKLSNMIDKFIDWYGNEYEDIVKHSRPRILDAFLCSKITKNIKFDKGEHWTIGIRALSRDESPGPEETYLESKDKYDFKNYQDYVLPTGVKLPFNNKIKSTRDAKDFLVQLKNVHTDCLKTWRDKHGPDVHYIM
jgi:hypothetical protein